MGTKSLAQEPTQRRVSDNSTKSPPPAPTLGCLQKTALLIKQLRYKAVNDHVQRGG